MQAGTGDPKQINNSVSYRKVDMKPCKTDFRCSKNSKSNCGAIKEEEVKAYSQT